MRGWSLQWVGNHNDAEAEDPNLMDPVVDWAQIYLDKFDRSNGNLIDLNRSPVKRKGSNLNLIRPKLSANVSKLNVGPKRNKLTLDHNGSTHGCANLYENTSSIGVRIVLNKVEPSPSTFKHKYNSTKHPPS